MDVCAHLLTPSYTLYDSFYLLPYFLSTCYLCSSYLWLKRYTAYFPDCPAVYSCGICATRSVSPSSFGRPNALLFCLSAPCALFRHLAPRAFFAPCRLSGICGGLRICCVIAGFWLRRNSWGRFLSIPHI